MICGVERDAFQPKECKMRAIRVDVFGGPEVLRPVEIPQPVPGPGEALIQHSAIGVNFVDTQHRAGTPYPVSLPLIPGTEAAGVVAAVGLGWQMYGLAIG
jgi:NADPH:quinone reductase